MLWKSAIPWSLIVLRFILGFLMLTAAIGLKQPQLWFGVILVAGLLSDVFDGILARRFGTETSALRVADSAVDTVFYLGSFAALVIRHRTELHQRIWLLSVLLVLEAVRYAFDWLKYGRMASYHSYLAKLWGLMLAAALISALCLDDHYWLITLAVVWGIVCNVEGLTISVALPHWTHDVKTLAHAYRLRREQTLKPAIESEIG